MPVFAPPARWRVSASPAPAPLEAGRGVTAARNQGSTPAKTPMNRGTLPVPQPEDLAKARAAYQDFLTLWKDADPDIPILKQAEAEYARCSNPSV